MATVIAWPTPVEFQGLIRNQHSAEQAEDLFAHLDTCPACWTTAAPLLEDDTLLRGVNQPAGPAHGDPWARVPALHSAELSQRETPSPSNTDDAVDSGEDDALPKPDAAGRWPAVGPYQILGPLGRGGMGVVFRAVDTTLNRSVALKMIRPHLARAGRARERFLSEARAAGGLRSDHIVTIYQTGEIDGLAFLAMELLEGESLAARLARGGVPMDECLRIGRETALGLDAAHRQGLIHRDIKPDNIWLERPGGRVKILDFGLARSLAGGMNLTRAGGIVGTPAYMAPEQAAGKTVDVRADLFSLGTVLYRLVTGRLPFAGEDILAVLSATATVTPLRVRSLNPAVPAALDALVTRLLAKDLQARPASAREVADLLARIDPTAAKSWTLLRRGWLGSIAGVPACAAVGYWRWPQAAPAPAELPPPPYRELRLPPRATGFVGNFHLDPARPITIEGFVTFESLEYPPADAQQVLACTSISIFAGKNSWNLGVLMASPTQDEFPRITTDFGPRLERTHLAMVHLGPQIRFYINGRSAGSMSVGHDWKFKPSQWFAIGGNVMTSRFDEVRVSTVPRYTKNFTPAERHEPDEHTFSLYHLDETDGLVLTDSSGHARHGTNHGGDWERAQPQHSPSPTAPSATAPPPAMAGRSTLTSAPAVN